MTEQSEQYKDEFYRFIHENKVALNAVMPINIDTLTPEDIRILCNFATYKAGEGHYQEQKGRMDKSLIDGVRVFFARPDVDGPKAIAKAFSWYEKGAMNKSSLKAAMFEQPEFSPRVEKYLSKKRSENYRKSFSDMRDSINNLADAVRDVNKLLKHSDEPLDSPAMALKMRKQLRKINGALNRCDQSGRSGIAWAHRAGIPMDKATNAVQDLYLKKLPGLEQAIRPLEKVLESQGIKSSIAEQLNRRQFLWRHDIKEVRQEVRRQSYKQPTQEQSHAFG